MAGYVCLMKFTNQGITNVKEMPTKRLPMVKAMAEKMGARVVGVWMTMGRYDLVTIVDVPDDRTAGILALALASQGNVSTETMRAFSEDEFVDVIAKLP
jgi:uncharacterized protein with GYD domain